MEGQPDLFGHLRKPVAKPNRAADATRRMTKTCWNDCVHCGTEHFPDNAARTVARRLYRLCLRELDRPEPVYRTDTLCPFFRLAGEVEPVKPSTRGWDDY